MLKKFSTTIMVTMLTACVSTPKSGNNAASKPNQSSDNHSITQEHYKLLTQRISTLEENITEHIDIQCKRANSNDSISTLLTPQSNVKSVPVNKLQPEITKNVQANVKEECTHEQSLVLGAIEHVTLIKEQLSFDTRIDTGAETSSIGVYEMASFERDGNHWVRFKLADNNDAVRFEYPVIGKVQIKQQSTKKSVTRLEIKIGISLGGKEYYHQVFNLADRSHLDYQVMIGRSFLTDNALVDVSKQFLLGTK